MSTAVAPAPTGLNGDGLLTVNEAAGYLALSRSKVYDLMNAGEIPWVKIGSNRRIRAKDVRELIERSLVGGVS
jgi:excisionase family DNA binding protein